MWSTWPTAAALFGLGAFHGVNPGMGWLFAVALGMQERRAAAVWMALLPLTAGHVLAVGLAIAVAGLSGLLLPLHGVRSVMAAVLVVFGLFRLVRHRHPRWRSMRVGVPGLTLWSFLMATAHGAGLMILPFVLSGTPAAVEGHHHVHAAAAASVSSGVAAAVVHTAGYLGMTAVVAWLVYARLGLARLRSVWINTDLVWAIALIGTGGLTLIFDRLA